MNDAAERLVRFTPELMERLATRSDDGYRLTVDWGDPAAEGIYTPTITVDYTDDLAADERRATVETIREEARCWIIPESDPPVLPWSDLKAILDAEAER